MVFEYDPKKSEANLEKHGIDFEEAQQLWQGWTVRFRANVKGETRFKVIGRIEGEYWTAIYTKRRKHIRIISVRRATPEERSIYDKELNNHR